MEPLVNAGIPFRSAEAPGLGISPNRLTRLVRAGVLRRMLRDVYVDSRMPDTVERRAEAAAFVLPSRGVIARRSAAWLHGIDAYAPDERDRTLDIETLVPLDTPAVRRRGVIGYEAVLDPSDVEWLFVVPVTTPTRTAIDLARWAPRPMGLAAMDAFLHEGMTDQAALRTCAKRFPGFRGIRQSRQLVELSEPLTESPGESWLRLRVTDAGFPRPRAQIPIRDSRGNVAFRLDLGYPDLRIGLEYDGEAYHSSPAQRRHDEARRERLRREFDWTVLGFTREHVLGWVPHVEYAVGELLSQEPLLPRRW